MSTKRRVQKLETGLTPKQAILLWLQDAHTFNTIEDYVRHLKTQPDSEAPLNRLTAQVEESVKKSLKGQSREEINRAVRQAHKDVLFLFFLHQQVNSKLLSENRYYWTQVLLLSKELGYLLKEQSRDRQMRWNRIRLEMQLPYPMDAETAAAIDAAKQHHVIPWEVLEEGDDLDQWLMDSFLAVGKTALPDGAYGLIVSDKNLSSIVSTEEEVRPLFDEPEEYGKFLAGEDYSYGLADVTDAEYDEHYEAIVRAMKGVVREGIVIDLPSVPQQFLQEAPLVDGDWIDRYIVELAEWGARLVEKGFLLAESHDSHPMAWQRIIDQEEGSEADAAVAKKLWQQTRKHLAGFPGRSREFGKRHYLSFTDYLKWKGRRNKGDLKSEVSMGLMVSRWDQWVEEQAREGLAYVAGVNVGKLNYYPDGYQYRVCRDAAELRQEMSLRDSLLESVQVGRSDSSDHRLFRHRVEHWKESALGFIPEIYTMHRAINSISQRYFDGQQTLFPAVATGMDQLLTSGEKLVEIYNEALAGEIERLEKILCDTGGVQYEPPLTIDLAVLIEDVQVAAKGQIAYLVDIAKSEALDVLGEPRQAWELVDRHV